MAGLQEYKCPCCGGAITFDSSIQKLKCPYCDTEFAPEALESYREETRQDRADEMNWETASKTWQGDEAEGLRSYQCSSCGGEITCDETTAASSCPYCGSLVVMTEQLSGALKPDYVIPFQLNKEAAIAILQKHYKGKRLLPKTLQRQNYKSEIKGVYLPFWLFDAEAEANMRYKATKIRRWDDDDYSYTETSVFAVERDGSIRFQRVPVDGSAKMPDDLLESIEPFHFSDMVEFQSAYLAGYLADKYDVNAETSVERANERIKRSTEKEFDATVKGYSTVTKESGSIQLHNGTVTYALLPVWLLSTKWNGQNYLFAINGQTGKLAGELPLDKAAYKKWLFGLTGVIGLTLYALTWLFWLL